jgi:hypothetical protein
MLNSRSLEQRVLIRLAHDIHFDIPTPFAMIALLNVRPSRIPDLVEPDPHASLVHEPDSYFESPPGA